MNNYFVTPHFITRRLSSAAATNYSPLPVDIRDDGEKFILNAFVPGLKAEDLKIQVVEDTLTLEGKYGNQEGQYLLSELPAGEFRRALRLPTLLDADRAEATIENGVLTLSIPRAEAVRPRSIQVMAR